jgi:hypothetical protein
VDGGTVADVGGGLAAVGEASVVVLVVVQEPAINATATSGRIRRARMTRTLHL